MNYELAKKELVARGALLEALEGIEQQGFGVRVGGGVELSERLALSDLEFFPLDEAIADAPPAAPKRRYVRGSAKRQGRAAVVKAASSRICSESGCGKSVLARGLCGPHYRASRKNSKKA